MKEIKITNPTLVNGTDVADMSADSLMNLIADLGKRKEELEKFDQESAFVIKEMAKISETKAKLYTLLDAKVEK